MSQYTMMSLVFEGSQGCQMNCSGCHIDKGATSFPSQAEQDELEGFLDHIESAGIELGEIEIGPTDLYSASNRQEFFGPYLRELVGRFGLTTMQLSLVHPPEGMRAFVREIEPVLSSASKINIASPIEIKHVYNDKYFQRLNENIEVIRQSTLPELHEVSLSIIFDQGMLTNVGSRFNYDELYRRVQQLDAADITRINFVFHHGRQGFDQAGVGERYVQSFRQVNAFFLQALERNGGVSPINKIPTHLVVEPHRLMEVVYRSGRLLMRPYLNGGLTLEDTRFEIPKPWNAAAFSSATMEAVARNYEQATAIEDCQSCASMDICAGRLVHDVMALSQTESCMLLLKDYKPVVLENFSNYEAKVERA